MPLTRDKFPHSPKTSFFRRFGALAAALAVQSLVFSVLLTLDEKRYSGLEPGAPSFTWLYLLPPVLQEEAVEVEPEVETFGLPAPENLEQQEADEIGIEDLEIIWVPTLRVTRPDAIGGAAIRLGLGRYFSCNLANYDTLTADERTNCSAKLASLRKERDLLDNDTLPYVLTANEARLWRGWQRNLLERQTPFLLPCLNASGFLTINVASIDCLIESIDDGLDPNHNPSNRYTKLP